MGSLQLNNVQLTDQSILEKDVRFLVALSRDSGASDVMFGLSQTYRGTWFEYVINKSLNPLADPVQNGISVIGQRLLPREGFSQIHAMLTENIKMLEYTKAIPMGACVKKIHIDDFRENDKMSLWHERLVAEGLNNKQINEKLFATRFWNAGSAKPNSYYVGQLFTDKGSFKEIPGTTLSYKW